MLKSSVWPKPTKPSPTCAGKFKYVIARNPERSRRRRSNLDGISTVFDGSIPILTSKVISDNAAITLANAKMQQLQTIVNLYQAMAGGYNVNNTESAEPAAVADFVRPYDLHDNVATSTTAGWDKKYQSGVVQSFMKRIPMHEPWPLHENQAPQQLTPSNTDRDA